jgi:dTMP kinase
MIVVFEGLDFSGKTTQIKLLKQYLESQGLNSVVLKEPDNNIFPELKSVIGKRKLQPQTELFLFLAMHVELTKKVHELFYESNDINDIPDVIIIDRFIYSTLAYQGVGRGLGYELTDMLINYFVKINVNDETVFKIKPDIVFYIDIPPEEVLRRRNEFREEQSEFDNESIEFFTKVRNTYLKLLVKQHKFIVLDGLQDVETIHHQIVKHYQRVSNMLYPNNDVE